MIWHHMFIQLELQSCASYSADIQRLGFASSEFILPHHDSALFSSPLLSTHLSSVSLRPFNVAFSLGFISSSHSHAFFFSHFLTALCWLISGLYDLRTDQ